MRKPNIHLDKKAFKKLEKIAEKFTDRAIDLMGEVAMNPQVLAMMKSMSNSKKEFNASVNDLKKLQIQAEASFSKINSTFQQEIFKIAKNAVRVGKTTKKRASSVIRGTKKATTTRKKTTATRKKATATRKKTTATRKKTTATRKKATATRKKTRATKKTTRRK